MSQIPGIGIPPSSNELPTGQGINQLEVDDFFGLLIAELQNQDPLNPLDNAQMLQQISQIREVGATDKLTQTLDAVLLGQNVSSATSLIGKEVRALAENGRTVTGVVDRITIADGQPELSILTSPRVEPSTDAGAIEAGTYRYKVVYVQEDGQEVAADLGPVSTAGVSGLDGALRLTNLPQTGGPKTIYRTDGSGAGDYHLLGVINEGFVTEYVDTTANANLPSTVLTGSPPRAFSGRRVTASLNNISEVRSLIDTTQLVTP